VLAKVDNQMKVAQEEIFGPVVTVIPFEDERDAIRIANESRYGLMATVWTADPARGHRLARAIKSGTIGINMPYTAFPGIPFGGYKQSGFGRELALETLELYLETKSVIVSTGARPINPFGLSCGSSSGSTRSTRSAAGSKRSSGSGSRNGRCASSRFATRRVGGSDAAASGAARSVGSSRPASSRPSTTKESLSLTQSGATFRSAVGWNRRLPRTWRCTS